MSRVLATILILAAAISVNAECMGGSTINITSGTYQLNNVESGSMAQNQGAMEDTTFLLPANPTNRICFNFTNFHDDFTGLFKVTASQNYYLQYINVNNQVVYCNSLSTFTINATLTVQHNNGSFVWQTMTSGLWFCD